MAADSTPPARGGELLGAEGDVLDTGAAGGMAIRGGLLRTLAFVLGLILSLASVPIMIRHLGVVRYGQFVSVTALVTIIGGVTEAGMTNLGIREYTVTRGADRERYLRSLAGLRLLLTAAGVALAVILTAASGRDSVIVEGTLLTGIGLMLVIIQQTYAIPLSVELKLGTVSALELARQAVLTGLVVVLVLAGAGLLPFFAASVGSGLAVLVLTLPFARSRIRLTPSVDLDAWKRIMRDVLPYAAATALGLVYFRLAVVLMNSVASGRDVGIFSAAFRIVEILGIVPTLIVSSAFPILARSAGADEDRLRYALQRMFETSLLLGGFICLTLALAAPVAIDIVAGPGFADSVRVLRLLSLALVTSFLVVTWSYALLSLRAHRQLLLCNALATITAAGGTLLLVPPLGPEGAALATVGAEVVLAGSYLIALLRLRPGLAPRLGVLPRIALAGCAGGAAALLPLPAAAVAVIGAVAFAVVAYATGAVPPEIAAALRRRGPY